MRRRRAHDEALRLLRSLHHVYPYEGDYALTLRLVPPLARSATWIEVLAAGRSAEVRARLPVRWQ